jgi:hypothetical protein
MAERSATEETILRRRGPRWTRVAGVIAAAGIALLILAIGALWIERRPIAVHYLKQEFERRGVQASYHLDRVGIRTQEVSNLVIGDPKRPDIVARHAIIQMKLKWDGSFKVYRVVARGVRLRGRLIHGKVSWGQIDKLMPPPSNKPFQLPDFVLDVADSSISLATPFGPVGVAVEGNGKLSGGFKGRVAMVSPRLIPGRCAALNLHANVAVSVVARRPGIDGPVTLDRFSCPSSKFDVVAPRFDANASFNEAFTSVDGRGRMAIQTLNAGANGLAAFAGELTYKGPLTDVRGNVKLAAQKSRMGTIFADRTRLNASYSLGIRNGKFGLSGDFAADSSALDPSMLAGVTQPLEAAAKTPIGPIAGAIRDAIDRTAHNFNAAGHIKVVNFPGGGAARIESAEIIGPGGARAHIAGGSGVTYYWPANGLRIDGNIQMGGGGLPNGKVALRQAGPGGPMSGVAEIAPYTARGSRLALAPIRFAAAPDGSTELHSLAQLDGPFPDGRVQALRIPIDGRIGRGAASPSAPAARWSASIIFGPARCSSPRRGFRSVPSGRPSSPSGPAGPCSPTPALPDPCSTAALAARRFTWRRPGVRSWARSFHSTSSACGSVSPHRQSRSMRPSSPAVSSERASAAPSRVQNRRSATSRCCSATLQANGWSTMAISA